MAGLSKEPVNTCSIAFDDPLFNESEFAKMVADRYGTNHFVETVRSDDFGLLDTLARLYDEPYADSSAIPTYRVCQLARKRVTVALSGDGGDETFGGYRRYRLHMMEERMRAALPQSLRGPLFGLLGVLIPKPTGRPGPCAPRPRFRACHATPGQACMGFVRDDMRNQLFSLRSSPSWPATRPKRSSDATPPRPAQTIRWR